jgi:manganese/zinc/iron transport system substrate-binding protein
MLRPAGCLALTVGCIHVLAASSFDAAPAGVHPARKVAYRVTTTVGMITDIVRNVAGEHAEVQGIIGEGVDPHLYKPTRGDVVKLSQADVVFYNGLLLEGKMSDVLARFGRQGKPVVAVTQSILDQGNYVIATEHAHYDPHVWMDVSGWIRAVGVVAEALSEFDPARAAGYQSRAAAYQARLNQLDAYAREVIASIPENQRVLVTAHDAFNYLGRAYGLDVRGIQGLSTESEAGVQDIERLVQFLAERRIPAVFVETSVADKNVRALVEGATARGHDVRIGGELFSDAMGPAGTYEGTYIGMIDHNVTTIARALGGRAPERGMQGKLSPSHRRRIQP